ncbi:fumarylacetoacetate hydrolase family protein [Limnobaculum xujianqingii]|uniref:fumarylacetoacetate hydrolase family protein n=1 Tax=Limnobaculum xujianqingii TaxID=2738837 RepID=UPI001129D7C6|nr:fumarylacetoacetate hydrolase family protein [Limnobaculum xujianqingii]
MKLASYLLDGYTSYGAVIGDRIVDLGSRLGGKYYDLHELIKADALNEAREIVKQHWADLDCNGVTFLPVIVNPGKIFCVGLNYEAHRVETRRDETNHPTIFLRLASSQQGHMQPLLLPPESTQLDYEGEIALIIGKGGRRIPVEQAMEHIAGYACYNDGSVRDWQFHTTQWAPGKNFDKTGAFGPWMVTSDEIEPGSVMTLITRLNGQEVQRTSTDLLTRGFAELIAYISTFATLEPGDVIITGTPGGIGSKRVPPLFMKDGDVVEVEVDKIGILRNPVVAEAPRYVDHSALK